MIRFNNTDSSISGLCRKDFFQNEFNTRLFDYEPVRPSGWIIKDMLKDQFEEDLWSHAMDLRRGYLNVKPETPLLVISSSDLNSILCPSMDE